jgi:hypothetical protein
MPDKVMVDPATVTMAANFIRRVVAASTFALYRLIGLGSNAHSLWVAGHILAHGVKRISARDIGRAYRELRGNDDAIVQAMTVLEHAGWVQGNGHPKRPAWSVNPAVHTTFADRAEEERRQRRRIQELIREPIDELVR